MGQQVAAGEFVISGNGLLQIRGKFAGTETGSLLNGDMMRQKQGKVGCYYKESCRLAVSDSLEPVCTFALLLIEPEVSKFHY